MGGIRLLQGGAHSSNAACLLSSRLSLCLPRIITFFCYVLASLSLSLSVACSPWLVNVQNPFPVSLNHTLLPTTTRVHLLSSPILPEHFASGVSISSPDMYSRPSPNHVRLGLVIPSKSTKERLALQTATEAQVCHRLVNGEAGIQT